MVSPVDAAVGQSLPAWGVEVRAPAAKEARALGAATERTTLRAGASSFVPSCLGPVRSSMQRSWTPHQDGFPNMAMQQMGPLDAAHLGPPPGLHDEIPSVPMQAMGSQRDDRTTVILRNLPCSFLREDLIQLMDAAGFAGLYNLVYMPHDFQTMVGMGYAFVNLVSADVLPRFKLAFDGFRKWPRPSQKVCTVQLSKTQGLEANVHRYRNSPGMGPGLPEHLRPVIFRGTLRVPFPPPGGRWQQAA